MLIQVEPNPTHNKCLHSVYKHDQSIDYNVEFKNGLGHVPPCELAFGRIDHTYSLTYEDSQLILEERANTNSPLLYLAYALS